MTQTGIIRGSEFEQKVSGGTEGTVRGDATLTVSALRRTREIVEIETRLHEIHGGYNYDQEYFDLQRRLTMLKNPRGNYNLQRREAFRRYLEARRHNVTPTYLSWTRQYGLAILPEIKKYFKELL